MEKRIASAAIFVCAVMALVAAAPLVAGGIHEITKGAKGPNASAMSWDFVAPDYGQWNAKITNNGLRWMVIEVADNETGVPVPMTREHIRFAATGDYPYGEVNSSTVIMAKDRPYVITAVPNGPKGTSAIVEDVFTIKLAPVAEFTATMNWMTVSVDASASYDPDMALPLSYAWSWGDGMSAMGVTATHTYAMEGTYTITLKVTDADGLWDEASQTVDAVMQPPELNAAFTATMSWMTVSVDASASTGQMPLTYSWEFGDGMTGSGVTATHTYANEGVYTITLTVMDASMATDTATAQVTAVKEPPPPVPPIAAFTATMNYLHVDVDASASVDPDMNMIMSYAWNFGDGNMGMGKLASHDYAMAGQYTITLTVTDSQGLSDVATELVTATEPPKPPVAAFSWTADYLTVVFNAGASTDPDSTIVSYAWNFGDGSMGDGMTPTHVYAMAGTYSVVLTVTDSQSLSDTETKSVTVVANTPPVASFTWTVTGTTVAFDARASTDDRGIVSYAWDFGDGMTGTGATPTHTYSKPVLGTHVVLAAPGVLQVPVTPYPVVGYTFGPDGVTPLLNSVVTITNLRTGAVINAITEPVYGLMWDPVKNDYPDLANAPGGCLAGDQIQISATNGGYSGTVTVTATPPGYLVVDVTMQGGPVPVDFTVKLTVTDGYGLSNTMTATVTIEFGA